MERTGVPCGSLKSQTAAEGQEMDAGELAWYDVIRPLLEEDQLELTEKEEELYWARYDIIVNKRLTPAARKKLSAGTFCGPGKSFPVPDCKHWWAALRVLPKYKGPGDRSKIKACIQRKGKELGCTKSKKQGKK